MGPTSHGAVPARASRIGACGVSSSTVPGIAAATTRVSRRDLDAADSADRGHHLLGRLHQQAAEPKGVRLVELTRAVGPF